MGCGIRRTQWSASDFGCAGVVSRRFGSIVHIASSDSIKIYYLCIGVKVVYILNDLLIMQSAVMRSGGLRDRFQT